MFIVGNKRLFEYRIVTVTAQTLIANELAECQPRILPASYENNCEILFCLDNKCYFLVYSTRLLIDSFCYLTNCFAVTNVRSCVSTRWVFEASLRSKGDWSIARGHDPCNLCRFLNFHFSFLTRTLISKNFDSLFRQNNIWFGHDISVAVSLGTHVLQFSYLYVFHLIPK